MGKLNSYSFNNVIYRTQEDLTNQTIDFKVTNPRKKDTPESLYKYYSLNNNSLDAFINHYLFSSHPMIINDKYDCAGELIDYSNLNLDTFIHHLSKELNLFSEDKVVQFFNSDEKWMLDRSMANLNQIILFMKFGIISLTENPKDTLMWAYYSQNSGFALKLNTSLLPKDFFGPFPINYIDSLNKIDFAKYDTSLCILYQTNVKQKIWESENEWRYLTHNQNGKYHPFYWNFDIKSRKFFYSADAIQEIILGYDFFHPKEIDYNKRTPEYDIIRFNGKRSKTNKKLKRKLLSYVVRNSIPCFQIVRHRYNYLLDVKEIKIEKLSSNRYKIYNSFKQAT